MAVIKHWLGWGGGGIVATILAICDYGWNWKLPKKVYAAFLLLGVFVSMFLAWQDQRTMYLTADKEKNAAIVYKERLQGQIEKKDNRIEELRDLLASRPTQDQPVSEQPTLSDAEKIILTQELWGGRGNTITIVNVGADSLPITAQLREVFQRGGWVVIGGTIGRILSATLGDSGAGAIKIEGLYLIARDPSSPSVRVIVSSFEQAGRTISVNGSAILGHQGDLTLYAEYGNN